MLARKQSLRGAIDHNVLADYGPEVFSNENVVTEWVNKVRFLKI